MAIHKTAGTRLFVSPTAVSTDMINAMSDSDAITFFEAIDDWLEVEEVEDFGELGDTSEEITFTAVGNRRVRKLKGPRNAGTQAITVGRDPLDDGQEAFIAAEATDFNYPIMITLADAQTPNHSNSVLYYAGLVMSKPINLGNVTVVTRRTFNVGINTAVFEVASEVLAVPANLVPPSIVYMGDDVFRANRGVWSNHPDSYTILWEEDDTGWTAIANGATQEITYTGSNDIRVTVTATNGAGASDPATSLPVTPPA